MALVATINGRRVYSDKECTGVVNTRVIFSDGSWCDGSTGTIHNAGRGYISFDSENGSASGSSKKVTKGPERAMAGSLHLSDLFAKVQIDVYGGRDIEYSMSGPEDLVNEITANVRSGVLYMKGAGKSGSGGSINIQGGDVVVTGGRRSVFGGIVSLGRGSSVSIGDVSINGVNVGGSDPANDLNITIRVPVGTGVTLESVKGRIMVADIKAQLTASLSGSTLLEVGSVTNAQLTLQGASGAGITEVNGSLTIVASGSSDVRVRRGSASAVVINTSGASEARFDGVAEVATLVSSGASSIRVERVKHQPVKNKSGASSISVRNIG